jgi:hypothetical protein
VPSGTDTEEEGAEFYQLVDANRLPDEVADFGSASGLIAQAIECWTGPLGEIF